MAEKFLKVPEPVGQLYYDCILLDGDEPVLFTCTNDNKELYYCVCIYNVLGAQEWLITRTTPRRMCHLLTNSITMRRAITLADKIWFAKECQDGHIEWKYENVDEFPDDYLPTDGMYMDADDGEFDEEIKHFKNMIKNQEDQYCLVKIDNKNRVQTVKVIDEDLPFVLSKSIVEFNMTKDRAFQVEKLLDNIALTKQSYVISEHTIQIDSPKKLDKKKLRLKKQTT